MIKTNEQTIHLRLFTVKAGRELSKLLCEECGQWTGACLHKEGNHTWNDLFAWGNYI